MLAQVAQQEVVLRFHQEVGRQEVVQAGVTAKIDSQTAPVESRPAPPILSKCLRNVRTRVVPAVCLELSNPVLKLYCNSISLPLEVAMRAKVPCFQGLKQWGTLAKRTAIFPGPYYRPSLQGSTGYGLM